MNNTLNDKFYNLLKQNVIEKVRDILFSQKITNVDTLSTFYKSEDCLLLKKENINDYLNICFFEPFCYVKNHQKKGKMLYYESLGELIHNEHIDNIALNEESLVNLYEILQDTNAKLMDDFKEYLKKQPLNELFNLLNNTKLNNKHIDIAIEKTILIKSHKANLDELIENINTLPNHKQKLVYKRLISNVNNNQEDLFNYMCKNCKNNDKDEIINYLFTDKKQNFDFLKKSEFESNIDNIIEKYNSIMISKLGKTMNDEKLEFFINRVIKLNNKNAVNFLNDLQHTLLINNNTTYEKMLEYKQNNFNSISHDILLISIKRAFGTLNKLKCYQIANKTLEVAKINNYKEQLMQDLMNNTKLKNNGQIYTFSADNKNTAFDTWLKVAFKDYLEESLINNNSKSKRMKI